MKQDVHDIAVGALKSAPPVVVSVIKLFGISLSDWVLIFTLMWLLLQMGGWCWDRYKRLRFSHPEHDRRRQRGVVNQRVVVGLLALSATGLLGILSREDIKLAAYPDPVQGWALPTIGAGSTVGVKKGDTITPLQAVQRTVREASEKELGIKRCLAGVPLYQREYDAYVRLAHNIGADAFCSSTVAARARAGDYAGACDAILMWDRAGPVKRPSDRCSHPANTTCRGLWRDRQETRALCLGQT